ncbi:S66 peptidase family protein [Alloiococcus sp. CFN-8]|uniref:S66 peptidase family protein n=1 Tax=Alloiococcus sp. CFN-8 TaxID=3416081 RepID=UPI003CEFE853
MKLPKRITKASTIGIIAPASPRPKQEIDEKLSSFSSLGFNIIKGSHLYDSHGYLAGKDIDRAEDLNLMYSLKEVDAIVCYRGGYGTMRMMPYVDYNALYNNLKIFVGYSDLTIFLNYIADRFKTITFHGPMASSDFSEEYTRASFFKTIMEGYEPYTILNPENHPIESNCDLNVEGRLAGGNLSLIYASLGTPYEVNLNNKILFIEEIGEKPYTIDRMLTALLLSGKLRSCRGIILGHFTDCDDSSDGGSLTVKEVLQDRITRFNLPVITGLCSGHSYPNLTLPIGAKIRMDCKNKKIEVLEPVVR